MLSIQITTTRQMKALTPKIDTLIVRIYIFSSKDALLNQES